MGSCCVGRNCSNYHFEITPVNDKYYKTCQSLVEKDANECEDMPLITPEKYKGIGVKRMKAYKCDLKIDDLNKLRDHFWNAKINENIRWHFLRQACLYDSLKSEEYLIQHGFWLVDGCINKCTDHTKIIYRIPNYCVNDPYFEKELVSVNEKSKHDKEIEVSLADSNDIKTPIRINEGCTGKELKEAYLKYNQLDSSVICIRLFFGGNEIQDDHCLFQHKIKNKYRIQVLCIPKQSQNESKY